MIKHQWWVIQEQVGEREWRSLGIGFDTEELAYEYAKTNGILTGWYGAPVSIYQTGVTIMENESDFPVTSGPI